MAAHSCGCEGLAETPDGTPATCASPPLKWEGATFSVSPGTSCLRPQCNLHKLVRNESMALQVGHVGQRVLVISSWTHLEPQGRELHNQRSLREIKKFADECAQCVWQSQFQRTSLVYDCVSHHRHTLLSQFLIPHRNQKSA